MNSGIEVAIVGAGPYGLSVGAQLRALGTPFRIFGRPMSNWAEAMPAGMRLKSDGFASNLCDREGHFTLERFCAERNLPYHPTNLPVALETFVAYGLAFQTKCVSSLEQKFVSAVTPVTGGFRLTLANGTSLEARRVVIATGISHLFHVPRELEGLGSLCSHSSAVHDLRPFAGRRVLVVGGGASATDVAALLQQAGASVELFSRHPLEFHSGPGPRPRSLLKRIRRPHLGLGASLRSAIYTLFPGQFRLLPERLRLRIVKRHLGPAGGWFMREQVSALPVHAGYSVIEARREDNEAIVRFSGPQGTTVERHADHVIAATGYQVSLARLAFIDPTLREKIRLVGNYPALSANFESSVPGLYFIGLPAAGSFGPLMRFALGAAYASRRLSTHLSRMAARSHSATRVQVTSP